MSTKYGIEATYKGETGYLYAGSTLPGITPDPQKAHAYTDRDEAVAVAGIVQAAQMVAEPWDALRGIRVIELPEA